MATVSEIDLSPIQKNLKFRQGTDVNKDLLYFTVKDEAGDLVNLSTYSARAHFGLKLGVAPIITLTTAGGGIVLNETTGKIEMIITAAQTSALAGFSKEYKITGVWDLELVTAQGKTRPFMAGVWTLTQDIPHA